MHRGPLELPTMDSGNWKAFSRFIAQNRVFDTVRVGSWEVYTRGSIDITRITSVSPSWSCGVGTYWHCAPPSPQRFLYIGKVCGRMAGVATARAQVCSIPIRCQSRRYCRWAGLLGKHLIVKTDCRMSVHDDFRLIRIVIYAL